MASARFKRVFFIRFLSYFSILISIVWTAAFVFPIITAEFNYRRDLLFGVRYSLEPAIAAQTRESTQSALLIGLGATPSASAREDFSDIKSNVNIIKPLSTDYGIVIEKINANAKIVANVDPGNERQYTDALAQGVAESKGSTKPGEQGNLYIFSHSTDAPWNVSRFNAVFYLLRELEKDDKVVLFYQGKRFDYVVFDKTITDPKDTSFLSNRYDQPVLTLQTCDPPGTLSNRLIVRAKLKGS